MARLSVIAHFLLLFSLLSCVTTVLAAKPSSFCKCTCFSNSTIIELRPLDGDLIKRSSFLDIFRRRDDDKSGGSGSGSRALTCNDCNRKFCLEYNLPKCKGAKEEDVITTCFQRDSRKDEAVVFLFIFATGGLLVSAAVKPWAERWIEAVRERRSYIPISSENAG